MSKVGDPFKMEPLTRKARNSRDRAAMFVGVHADQLMWERVGAVENEWAHTGKVMVAVVGDRSWDTIRWVQTQNDPDWKIV